MTVATLPIVFLLAGWWSVGCASFTCITADGIIMVVWPTYMKICCGLTDRPTWALLTDLKQRGLLEDTLVIWGGEFGRTPMFQGKGELAGIIISKAFPCGWRGVESRVASATERRTSSGIMRRRASFACAICMPPCSISSESTTKISVYQYQGLDMRLTGVEKAKVVKPILS